MKKLIGVVTLALSLIVSGLGLATPASAGSSINGPLTITASDQEAGDQGGLTLTAQEGGSR